MIILLPYSLDIYKFSFAQKNIEEGKEENILNTVAKSIYWRSRRCDITGLVKLDARYYHPESRRFISPDPYGHTGSLDLYNYAGGDPVNDPDGRLFMASAGKN